MNINIVIINRVKYNYKLTIKSINKHLHPHNLLLNNIKYLNILEIKLN